VLEVPSHIKSSSLALLFQQYLGIYPEEVVTIDRCQKLFWTESQSLLRTCLPGHFTASSWIYSPTGREVLLMYHPKIGRFIQPGGHADGEDNLQQVAQREVLEETGVNVHYHSDYPLDISIHFISATVTEPSHYHYDIRYLCSTLERPKTLCSPEGHELAWVAVNQIARGDYGHDLVRLHQKTLIRFQLNTNYSQPAA
jgi:8-oxo-dGTP pyrophosphatase MutT (NUDIX family)